VIAEEVEGEALATLVVNKLRGTLNACAVKAPGFGDRRKAMLEDIGISPAASRSWKRPGIKLEGVRLDDLGRPSALLSTRTIRPLSTAQEPRRPSKAASAVARPDRRDHIDYDREKLQERLAKLAGGVAVIKVGAATRPR